MSFCPVTSRSSSSAVISSSNQCPFSSAIENRAPRTAFQHLKSASHSFYNSSKSLRSRSTSSKRLVTDFPDLRRTPSAELLYLPPLLSLLPPSTRSRLSEISQQDVRVNYTQSHLPTIDAASVALHKALHDLKPISDDYAYRAYDEAFNFDEFRLPKHLEREWYIVAFRSTRAKDSPSRDLYEADRQAHEEAVTAGGLLAYWFGIPNSKGSNLATCIWMSRADAVKAIAGPKHVEAMRLAEAMYENYDLERYVLRKVRGEEGVTVEPWRGGEVDFRDSSETH